MLRMHEEIPIEVALGRIIDDTSAEELGLEQSTRQKVVRPAMGKSRYLVCDMCDGFSTEKKINMYQHVWRQHRGAVTKEAMERITSAAGSSEVEK